MPKIIHHFLKQLQVHKVCERFSFFNNLVRRTKKFKVVPSQHIKLKSVVSRTVSNATIYNWVHIQYTTIYNIQQLPALN